MERPRSPRTNPIGAPFVDTRNEPVDQDFLVFGQPQILQEEIDEVVACLRSGWIGTGPRVAAFEKEFATYKGLEHVAAVGSCTAALHLSILAAGVEPGDEVITSPLTFCATVNAIIHAGGSPVLADIDPITMNLDPRQVEARITNRTRALVPVHFAGRPCEMDDLRAIARRHRLRIIEDCAHSLEAEYRGRGVGTFGEFGCFSFYATKNVTTGEGGMVVARSETDIAQIKTLALHGMTQDAWRRFGDSGYKHYYVAAIGFKYNMMDLQAAIGIHQLRRVEANWERRRAIWNRYTEALESEPLTLPAPPAASTRHAYHLYTVLIDERVAGIERDDFLEAMTRLGIGVGVHYLSLAEHPAYRERYGWKPEDWPAAERVGKQTVSLPLSPKLTDEQVERVIRAVRRTIARS